MSLPPQTPLDSSKHTQSVVLVGWVFCHGGTLQRLLVRAATSVDSVYLPATKPGTTLRLGSSGLERKSRQALEFGRGFLSFEANVYPISLVKFWQVKLSKDHYVVLIFGKNHTVDIPYLFFSRKNKQI